MRGQVIVLLLVCALPAIHHTVKIKAGDSTTLCLDNLLNDDAMEILDSNFLRFEDWGRAYCLTDATIKILESWDLDSRGDLLRITKRDIAALGVTRGQERVLELIVKKLEEAVQRERRNTKQVEVRRHRQSGSSVGGSILYGAFMGAAVGLGTLVAAPAVLTAAGFTTAGIAASSMGAALMSSTAVASGGGVGVGSTVAVLQSLGAAGIPAAVGTTITTGGAIVGGGVGYLNHGDEEDY